MFRRCLLGVTVLMVAHVAGANSSQVSARLVAEGSELRPGGTIRMGVLFEMEPGWHIYWKNPGDAGLSTSVEWDPPDGFTAGALQWPTPIQFMQPGQLVAYGYEGSALLAAEFAVPDELRADGLELAASVSWLACKTECVLGSAELQERLPLPVADEAFERWRRLLPEVEGPFSVSTIGTIDSRSRRGRLSTWIEWTETPARIEWFPEAGERLRLTDVVVRTRGSLTRIDFNIAVIGVGSGRMESLRSVVVADDGGARRGWALTVPLSESQ